MLLCSVSGYNAKEINYQSGGGDGDAGSEKNIYNKGTFDDNFRQRCIKCEF